MSEPKCISSKHRKLHNFAANAAVLVVKLNHPPRKLTSLVTSSMSTTLNFFPFFNSFISTVFSCQSEPTILLNQFFPESPSVVDEMATQKKIL